MRIGLLGGSFDPPHRGHLLIAQAARKRFRLDRVLLAPVGIQPLKPGGSTAAFADRLAMTSLLCGASGVPGMEVSMLDAPLPSGAPNYTVDTLTRLHSTLTAEDVPFVITGADAFLDLRRWRSPKRLLSLAEWIVVSRPGIVEAQIDELGLTPIERARVHWLGDVWDPVSATDVRSRLAAGLDCRGLLPDAVLTYIHAHMLYAAPGPG